MHEVECQQAVRAAATHGPRPHFDYQPTHTRVIAVQLPTTVWISHNHHLVKAAPEKLRPAAEEENLSMSGWLDGIGNAKRQFETADIKGTGSAT